MSLTPQEIAHCKFIAEIEAGVLTPYFVDVPDGHYTKMVVVDEDIPISTFETAWTPSGVFTLKTREAPCHIPRYKKELRYKRG